MPQVNPYSDQIESFTSHATDGLDLFSDPSQGSTSTSSLGFQWSGYSTQRQ